MATSTHRPTGYRGRSVNYINTENMSSQTPQYAHAYRHHPAPSAHATSYHHNRQQSAGAAASTTVSTSSSCSSGNLDLEPSSAVAEWCHQMHVMQKRRYEWCHACFPRPQPVMTIPRKEIEQVRKQREESHAYQ